MQTQQNKTGAVVAPQEQQTIQQFIDKHKVTMTAERISVRTDLSADQWDKDAFHFLVTVQYDSRDYKFPYSMGSGHAVLIPFSELLKFRRFHSKTLGGNGNKKDYDRLANPMYKPRQQYEVELRALMFKAPEPDLPGVLDCLASDYSGYVNSRSFEDWAPDYGYDTDSRKAEKIYHAVRDAALNIERLFGREVAEELINCERL